MARATLLDIAKLNLGDAEVGLIEEAIYNTPEVTGLDLETGQSVPGVGLAKTIKGINYYTKIRTSLPSAGFRHANEGVVATKSTFANRLVEAFILNPRWECDKAVADRNEEGPEAFIAEEASAILQAGFLQLARNFYYGTNTTYSGDAKGHPGLLNSYDATNMVVDAAGTTDSTCSSVWMVKWGVKDVRWVIGLNGELAISDVRIESLLDASNNPYTGYVQELLAYMGLQVGSTNAVCRIKKLTADAGKGLTDDLVAEGLEKFPAGVRPDVMFMTKRSRRQLQNSRTAVNATGAPAPFPTESHGVPIIVTSALSNVETLTL